MKKQLIKGHHGDVQFRQLVSIPSEAKKIENKPIAYGEHSGHQHIITGESIDLFEMPDGTLIAVVGKDGGRLQHIHESKLTTKAWRETKELEKADHNSHLLSPGIYEFWIQNSFNPYSKLMEKVID
jgi:hypothetical protein